MFDKLLAAGETIYRQASAKRRLDAEAQRERIAGCRVLSVGNLTVGGTGKTPCVQWAARLLQEGGKRVAVVSRGYGGKLSNEGAVVSDGSQVLLSAAEAGDEPLLHARALPGVAVLIGRDRAKMCRRAVAEFGAEIAILDDGFQFWSLARDFDLLLLDARRPFDNGHLLPRGRLREKPVEASRADAILLTRAALASPAQIEASRREIRSYSQAPQWIASHAPQDLRDEATGKMLSLSTLRGTRVAALSALADNAAFARVLRDEGAEVVFQVGKRDHHAWQEGEVRAAVEEAQRAGATSIITTEKDAVKLSALWALPLPLHTLRIAMQVEHEDTLARLLKERLGDWARCKAR